MYDTNMQKLWVTYIDKGHTYVYMGNARAFIGTLIGAQWETIDKCVLRDDGICSSRETADAVWVLVCGTLALAFLITIVIGMIFDKFAYMYCPEYRSTEVRPKVKLLNGSQPKAKEPK